MKKIFLCCSAGMSTSIIVQKMENYAKQENIKVEIDAYGLEQFYDIINNYDLCLLGPQVRYKEKEFSKYANEINKKVAVINMADYGTMNGEKILKYALNIIG